jgi:23S rRNA (adenine2503-C2)-methyltransferase
MKVVAEIGRPEIALVYVAETASGKLVEFAESLTPPVPREKKWVLLLSTLYGCPVGCRFCDAGSFYGGKLSVEEMLSQIDYMVWRRFPTMEVPVEKFKIQFARMGEPAYNMDVLDVLAALPSRYRGGGVMPSVSTIAPCGTDRFFRGLLAVKKELYGRRFQLQFSIHTTDTRLRDWLMPVRKWDFERIAAYADDFLGEGDRKITLNFALAEGMPVDPRVLRTHFSPDKFLIKITPVNPTCEANRNGISSRISPHGRSCGLIDDLEEAGYEIILSIGEPEENLIGSNCGQHVMNYLRAAERIENGYTYAIRWV